MPPRKAKKGEPRTWDGLGDSDITGADEAEAEQLIEFGRRSKDPPKPPEQKEPRCPGKPRR
jgi:hypothetical protein